MLFSIAIEGEDPKTVFIDQEKITIGRSSKASIQVLNECVSRFHIEVRLQNGELFVTDLGSANGTYINEERLPVHEEVKWHTFLPLNLSHKILINLISQAEEDQKEKNSEQFYLQNKNESPDTPTRTKTKASNLKVKVHPAKKINQEATSKKPYIILAVLILCLGYWLNQNFQTKEDGPTTAIETIKPSSANDLSKFNSLISENKCVTELEKNYCHYLQMNSERYEGVLTKNNTLYVFLNYDHRLKNVMFDPSFSFADKKDQITYLMVFFAFGEVTKNVAQRLKVKELIMIDTTSSPVKINHTLHVSLENLLKVSSSDVETIKQMILDKRDNELYKNVIFPLIKINSAY